MTDINDKVQETTLPTEKEDDNTKVELKGQDAALVLREDGQMEIFFPKQDEDAPVGRPALTVFKLSLVFKVPEIGVMLDKFLDKEIEKIEESDKNNQNSVDVVPNPSPFI